MRRRLPALLLASLVLAGCGSTGPTAHSAGYDTSGFEIRDVQPRYYDAEERPVDLEDPEMDFDENGAVVSENPATGEMELHPVGAAQHGLFSLAAHDRNDESAYLNRAVANGQALIDNGEERDGALWFPYHFDFALGGDSSNTIRAPWYSGMAQGQALSLFVRLYEHDGNPKWREAADKTFESFFVEKRENEPWVTLSSDGNLWFEEYAGNTDPLLVINGHIFAIFGLYDYHLLTEDPRAKDFLDAGITTIRDVFDKFRTPGGVSDYCVQPERCLDEDGWPSEKYHMIHIQQLEMLTKITGEQEFSRFTTLLREDFNDPTIPL